MFMPIPILSVLLATAIVALIVLITQVAKKSKINQELKEALNKYKGIIDVESEISKKKSDLDILTGNISKLENDYKEKDGSLNQDYMKHKEIYEALRKEVSLLEENLENISFGIYKPHYDYKTSAEFKQKLEEIIERQKQAIKNIMATHCPINWQVGGSKAEGTKMTKHYSKLMLRAFNGECDAAIAKVRWNNINNMETRIEKAYEAINKLGASHQITVTKEYYDIKLQELHLEFELQEKLYQEKEEQRKIREQMREEEKAQREIEKARKEAEDEEERNEKALQKAKAEIEKAKGQELERLTEKIKLLEENLQKAHELKERAISRAQLTKSGHVYIISNIGSFGETVYKIGMTRRLDPMDRIDELGDASVPFDFDVHGMIYSENAPELESILHKKIESKRVNLVNQRAEFFNTTIDEIEAIVKGLSLNMQLTKIAEAKEYRETLALKEARNNVVHKSDKAIEEDAKFPARLSD
jgi:DNA repair exonuclease SbcCD ATPase subunit